MWAIRPDHRDVLGLFEVAALLASHDGLEAHCDGVSATCELAACIRKALFSVVVL